MNSNELKDIRSSLEWTQAELAEVLGVSLPTLKRYEGGGSIPEPVARLVKRVYHAEVFKPVEWQEENR